MTDPDYDEDLLFAATVMHDLGLSEEAPAEARFEVEGADIERPILFMATPLAALELRILPSEVIQPVRRRRCFIAVDSQPAEQAHRSLHPSESPESAPAVVGAGLVNQWDITWERGQGVHSGLPLPAPAEGG
jgi:hypothetical protein